MYHDLTEDKFLKGIGIVHTKEVEQTNAADRYAAIIQYVVNVARNEMWKTLSGPRFQVRFSSNFI